MAEGFGMRVRGWCGAGLFLCLAMLPCVLCADQSESTSFVRPCSHSNPLPQLPSQMSHTPLRACVIGAGPAGLVSAKELLEQGIVPTVFERSASIGGVYAAMYDFELTTSNNNTCFGSFRHDDEARPAMWRNTEYVAYLERFAAHFSLFEHIIRNTEVVTVLRTQHPVTGHTQWRVTVRDLASPSAAISEHEFDFVVVCSGVNASTPFLPGLA